MHFIELKKLSKDQVLHIFNIAKKLKKKPANNAFIGKTFLLFFPETSIRTRITFEKGIKNMGGECILFPPETLEKREDPIDVMKYIGNWVDAVIIRHPNISILKELAFYESIPVLNAMTEHNHPCEIISDLFSISEIRENYSKLVYTFVGPANNISRSWTEISEIMNLNFNHVCTKSNAIKENNSNYRFTTNLEDTLIGSDIVLTDSLPNEYLTTEYLSQYQITLERMNSCKNEALLIPCPPFFRNEEVTNDVINSEYFVGHSFKTNLLYVQQAIIAFCLGIEI